jgi:hypothetical protein
VIRTAEISPDGIYRWRLDRHWVTDRHQRLLWVLLNPSTADGEADDPTIRRCIRFSRDAGYGGLTVVNLYALRATKPAHLEHHPDPVGPDNIRAIGRAIEPGPRDHGVTTAVLAWGAGGQPRNVNPHHADSVISFLTFRGVDLVCLGKTADGSPRHPLYVRADRAFEPFLEQEMTA